MLDAGVLVAAAIAPRGVCGRLLDGAIAGRFELIVSPSLLAELERVLLRAKFRRWLTEREVRQVIAAIVQLGELHEDPPAEPGLTPDPKDDYLVSLARAVDADYLISGDRHLTGLIDPRPPVLAPRVLLDQLNTQP
ncbi:MAG: putative toxin-antitoxin system toxin component, PIN family [Solirubrobacteraceae bacterium]